MIFLVVFALALGSLAYSSGLQGQAFEAEQASQAAASRRLGESLGFGSGSQGLQASNRGPTTVVVNHLILRYPNGTVYSLPGSATIPTGGGAAVSALVPAGVCSPGTATCVSKYDQIVSGNPPGASLGLLTSMGNVFWYAPAGGGAGWSGAAFQASGTWTVPAGVDAVYVVCIGGGGGGGGSGGATDITGATGGGGGGGGGVGSLAQGFVNLMGTATVAVTVGQGGAGGTAGGFNTNGGQGGNGGSSAFGAFVACGGGQGGGGGSSIINQGSGTACAPGNPAIGGSGDGIPGGANTVPGAAANAIQQTLYGGGGGGGSSTYTPPGAGSYSGSLGSGSVFTSAPGASGFCAGGGGGGSASPFGNGGTGGGGATSCSSGQPGGTPQPNSGAGGGGAGGSYSTSSACSTRAGQQGGSGGTGEVIAYYQG